MTDQDKVPIRLLHDRVLVEPKPEHGDRRSRGGIVIPETAAVGKRLIWGEAVGVGGNVRTVEKGDQVLYDSEDKAEVELHATTYILLRERDVHAVAARRIGDGLTGLYL